MTLVPLVQEFIFAALVAAPIPGFRLMKPVVVKRLREVTRLLRVGLTAAVGITSGRSNDLLPVVITAIALLCFRLLHRIPS